MCYLQANLETLLISESDPDPQRLILYSNLPITCQGESRGTPFNCWVTFAILSSEDVATRQRLPSGDYPSKNKAVCIYQLNEADWKPETSVAYNYDRSLDIVAKVDFIFLLTPKM